MDKECSSHIDQWINCAVMKGGESIDLDLSECCSFKVDHASSAAFEQYEFRCWHLAAQGRECTLKHLKLASCTFSVPLSSKCLTSLVTIELRKVFISDQQLKNLLSICLLLEGLSLHQCQGLENLNFVGPRLRMKFLDFRNCFRMEKIEISADNLVTIEYTGLLINFIFKNVPKLARAFLNFTCQSRLSGVTYALTRIASDLPQLETLNLLSTLTMNTLKLPENGPTFTNVKQLLLTIFPFEDEDRLCWITFILKTFPLLQKLQLNLFCPAFIKPPKEITRLLPQCPHKHLTEVEINGFYGNQHEVELLIYLLDNLVPLKVLVVRSCQKVYRGFNNWVYEEASSWYKLRLKSMSEWLHAVVPPTVHLEIC